MNKTLDFFPFGFQYYRAPTPHPDQWEGDIRHMAACGFTIVKIWVQWSTNQPTPDRYDFSDCRRLLDLCGQYGLRVILNIVCDTAPIWLYREHPDCVMETADGRKLQPRTLLYRTAGGAPGPCLNHPAAAALRRAFVEEAARALGGHPALYCWDLWNEPELSVGIYRQPNMDDLLCYCPHCVAKFQRYLQERYGDIEALNARWQRNYRDFSDIIDPPRCGDAYADMIDWRQFAARTVTDEVRLRKESVRAADPHTPVMVHTVTPPYFNLITTGSHDFDIARECDLFGNSCGSPFTVPAFTRSAAPDKPIFNAEVHLVGGTTLARPSRYTLEDFKRHIFRPLAEGIQGFLFWQYRPELLGRESPAWGVTRRNGDLGPYVEYCRKINDALQARRDVLLRSRIAPPQAAVLYSYDNEIFTFCAGDASLHSDSQQGAQELLEAVGVQADFLCAEQLTAEALDRYRLVYVPFTYYMSRATAEALRGFVERGGCLIAEALLADYRADDNMHSTESPGWELPALFGARESSLDTADTFRNAYDEVWNEKSGRDTISITQGLDLEGHYYRQAFACEGAEPLAWYDNGDVAVTRHTYGKGQAVLIGTLPGYACHKKKGKVPLSGFARLIGEVAGLKPLCESNAKVWLLYDGERPSFCIVDNASLSDTVRISGLPAGLMQREGVNILDENHRFTIAPTFSFEQPAGTIACYALP